MERLFTYGTLQDQKIQQKLFGRVLSGTPDILPDYEKGYLEIEGKKYNCANFKRGESIEGIVYDLANKELERADRYEGKDYKRVKIKLLSGTETWLYLRS